MSIYEQIKFDCKHFRGAIPCLPNKLRNKVCTCDEYKPFDKRILFIKLGALGDVIRTTPLVVRYRQMYPDCHITWITLSPEILPKQHINEIHKLDFLSVYKIKNQRYDIAINLDKEVEACALLRDVQATEKYGFIMNGDHIDAATPAAQHKLVTGLFDNISKQNTKNYLEEIFEICHLDFKGEPYLLNYDEALAKKWNIIREKAGGKKIVGLNTGCGARWTTRLWPKENWIALIKELQHKGYFPIVLGGKDEDELNQYYAAQTGCYYPGHYSLQEFIALTSNCDIIVTQVSMMMHIAIGLKKTMILFNNIFNAHEFELYGNGVIVQPTSGCDCYYGNTCKRDKSCMYDISVETVVEKILSFKK